MKNNIVTGLILVLLASLFLSSLAFATGKTKTDLNSKQMQIFSPSVMHTYSATKLAQTHDTTGLIGVRVKPTAAVSMQFNGTGTLYPLAANTPEEFGVGEGVTSVKFTLASSATKTKVHVLSY